MISIWADGSSTGRADGPGGYGFVIVRNEQVVSWGYGGSPRTTNNLMEIEGGIQGLEEALALELHTQGELLELVSDSQYCLGMASGAYTATKNIMEAERLQALATRAGCRFRWVKGHKGTQYNEYCDQLAKQGKLENTAPEDVEAQRAARKVKKLRQKAKKRAKKVLLDTTGPGD